MRDVLTSGEIRASLEVGGRLADAGEMPDPVGWVDLRAQPDETVAAVRARLRAGRTPLRGQVFRWPKETGGYRPMAWIDPLDQIIYRGTVGRLVSPIVASVRRPALERVLGALPVHAPTFEFVLDWLDELAEVYGIKGLPTGHHASQILAGGLLVPCDELLENLGVPFMRYVDDTWFFVDQPDEFEAIIEVYGGRLDELGLRVHPTKTKWLDQLNAMNEIQRFAIAYAEDELREHGPAGLAAGLELFEVALEAPIECKSELRRALTCLAEHRSARPIEALRDDGELLRLAPRHWVKYLGSMMANKPSRKVVGDDWLLDQVTRLVTKDDGYRNLLYLQGAARCHLNRDLGRRVLDVATNEGGWSAPVRVWAADVWGRSDAFNPNIALEWLEERGDYCTRRAFALTLDQRRSDPNMGRWLRRVRGANPELEPTTAWLEAA